MHALHQPARIRSQLRDLMHQLHQPAPVDGQQRDLMHEAYHPGAGRHLTARLDARAASRPRVDPSEYERVAL
jgi:hypothetical protein